jgi:two-component system CheB/CheR fusion protein
MAFILVQHLDPTHESMMADLLTSHTSMIVRQAAENMPVEPGHLYVIPPGTYLSVAQGKLHLSQPVVRHGARMPFDFLLHALAEEYGAEAICLVLSGTGTDGSIGVGEIKKKGGYVIAQDPREAGYGGMARGAIDTGGVDIVLPVAKIPDALIRHVRPASASASASADPPPAPDEPRAFLPEIIAILRRKTPYDFTLYKEGTLSRRIERRMAMARIRTNDPNRYLDMLRTDNAEPDLLAKDLLINVTSFFRDPGTFAFLAEKIIPELIGAHTTGHPFRIWVAGCSTGEETYSLAILFQEAIAAAHADIKLQVFASDVDPDAVAQARDGLYPATIETVLSPERLARHFVKDPNGYRVSLDLRAMVVFTVQDVLADPPFSRLDFISCRNLLIYLRSEAQAKVIARFHFALRAGGILVLGRSETAGDTTGRFTVVSKPERVYRRTGRFRPDDMDLLTSPSWGSGNAARAQSQNPARPPSRRLALSDLSQRLVMETLAPASVLINRNNESLYSLGPTDRYLRVAPGHPTNDLLTMAREGVRTGLRSAVQRAWRENKRIVIAGARLGGDDAAASVSVVAQPVMGEDEELMLVSFIEETVRTRLPGAQPEPGDLPRINELERELDGTKTELRGAIRDLEVSSEEQKAINEEALSVNQEFQATNEELLASKEELQSINEELTALNTQLHETLDLKRTISNDLQNVLYSTDVATLFLDTDLKIRLFTPATRLLFSIIAGDVGRPIADLHSLANDSALHEDAITVLRTVTLMEREIEAENGAWYIRRILPYRTGEGDVEGVVVTFTDITERRRVAHALETAKQQADLANAAKSRFLAAASHDLRQPLQALVLLHGLLMKTAQTERDRKMIGRLDETVGAMSGMLDALLDINQIEVGNVRPEIIGVPINDLFDRLREEFNYNSDSQRVALRVVSCGLFVLTDPRLLEQMVRNLLSNALKYTRRGKVLLGCRRHATTLTIEVWDTGIGIPPGELQAIFEEYHQLDNVARERSRGLGLGLSIVKRLGHLLGHRIDVRSTPGKGSVFTIEVPIEPDVVPVKNSRPAAEATGVVDAVRRTGSIMVVDDDPEVCELLELLLVDEGHHVVTAHDGVAALDLVTQGMAPPDLILADYNLPKGLNGLQLTAAVRKKFDRPIPVVILTGDISATTTRDIINEDCEQLTKPVKTKELTQVIQRLLPVSRTPSVVPASPTAVPPITAVPEAPVIFVVDDDIRVREALRAVLEEDGRTVEDYASCEAFLAAWRTGRDGCLLVDAYLPGMNGLELLQWLHNSRYRLPAIMITGHSDVPMAVQAMKAGATDFIEKPIGRGELLASIEHAFELSRDSSKMRALREDAAIHVAGLTARQREIMNLVLAGQPSKNIAADLGISQRTVENHRAEIMKRTGVKSLPALARLVVTASRNAVNEPAD